MKNKRLNEIRDVKSLEELQKLKLKKKYEMQLRNLELKSNLIHLQRELDPQVLKKTMISEGQAALQNWAMKILPSFVFRFFK